MGVSRVLVVSWKPGPCEPLLALLRVRRCWPVLISDVAKLTGALEDASVALIVLNGSEQFCRPYFDLFGDLRLRHAALPPLLILAGDSSEQFAISSLRAGAVEYLREPIDLATLAQCISRFVPECTTQPKETALTGGEVLVGDSTVVQALRTQIRLVAASDCNVLITGETGTGKELVAQLIHRNSRRNKNPLVSFNCAAIPDTLLESELFGYERGAFTGAAAANQGKLMAANHGSVFFDEIGDMSPMGQAKVLRAIEAKEVQRLGATRRYETDIRILAATHHNLDELASANTFRRDLYFRLNVGRIYLPPLRERKADIAGLVDCMIADLNKRLGRRVEGVTSAIVRRLAQHDWPGNVRELKNVIERVFIMRESGRISESDLSFFLPERKPPASRPLDEEIHCLREALATCNGNKSKAAETLNCSRMTLYRKLAKYGMDHYSMNSGPM